MLQRLGLIFQKLFPIQGLCHISLKWCLEVYSSPGLYAAPWPGQCHCLSLGAWQVWEEGRWGLGNGRKWAYDRNRWRTPSEAQVEFGSQIMSLKVLSTLCPQGSRIRCHWKLEAQGEYSVWAAPTHSTQTCLKTPFREDHHLFYVMYISLQWFFSKLASKLGLCCKYSILSFRDSLPNKCEIIIISMLILCWNDIVLNNWVKNIVLKVVLPVSFSFF